MHVGPGACLFGMDIVLFYPLLTGLEYDAVQGTLLSRRFCTSSVLTFPQDNRDSFPNVGMFTYPILQAADILLYM
jgi:hypothetical protein